MRRLYVALWILAATIGASPAVASESHYVVPPEALVGSELWLNAPTTLLAGQPEVVYCDLPSNSYANGLTGLWRELEDDGSYGRMVGHFIWLRRDLCSFLVHPRTRDDFWFAGHAAEVLGHEIAHDLGYCGDDAADALGLRWSTRVLQTVLGSEGIRVRPWQRQVAWNGAVSETRGPTGLDPIGPGCRDYQGATT